MVKNSIDRNIISSKTFKKFFVGSYTTIILLLLFHRYIFAQYISTFFLDIIVLRELMQTYNEKLKMINVIYIFFKDIIEQSLERRLNS